jgi:hypothetical protein
MSVKSVVLGAVAALFVFATGAQAAVITFENDSTGIYVSAGGSEAGFDYRPDGAYVINTNGDPGHDAEGYAVGGGGGIVFTAADSSLFTFGGLDYFAYDSRGLGSQILTVSGWRDGSVIGTDFFDLANTSFIDWTLFGATNLAGIKLDSLSIQLNAGTGANFTYWQSIDNVGLSPSAVPEPATWAMMIVGFGLGGAMLSRRRVAATARA